MFEEVSPNRGAHCVWTVALQRPDQRIAENAVRPPDAKIVDITARRNGHRRRRNQYGRCEEDRRRTALSQ